MRLRSSQGQPANSGPHSLAFTQRNQGKSKGTRSQIPVPVPPSSPRPAPQDPMVPEATREAIEQQAATYVESVRLRMIAQGIPFESPRFTEGAGPSTRVPVFDRLGPPLPIQNRPEDLRHRSVKPAMTIPSRRIQLATRTTTERRSSLRKAEVSIRSKRESKAKSVMQQENPKARCWPG